MIDLRKTLVAGALAGMTLSQSVSTAQAGPLLERKAADPVVQTAALEPAALQPVELTDESMDNVSAGVFPNHWPAISAALLCLSQMACRWALPSQK